MSDRLAQGPDGQWRCKWCEAPGFDMYRDYHDREWGYPVHEDRRLFEKLCLEGFQSGLSWRTILAKRENFRRAFKQFEIAKVARNDVMRAGADGGYPMSEADLDYYTQEFSRTGFRGGLNWYRNLRRNWELGGPWRGQPIRQPSLFIAGERDGVLRFPAAQAQLDAYPKTLPGLRGSHILDGAGHWVQQEKSDEVNRLLLRFLKST